MLELLLFCHLLPPFGLSVGLRPLTSLLYNLTYEYFLVLPPPLHYSSQAVPSSAIVLPSLPPGRCKQPRALLLLADNPSTKKCAGASVRRRKPFIRVRLAGGAAAVRMWRWFKAAAS